MRTVRLSEIISSLESGSRPKSGVTESPEIPSIGGEQIARDGTIRKDKLRFITTDTFNALKSGRVKLGDILIVKDGATTGKTAYFNGLEGFSDIALNEHVFRCQIDSTKASSRFAYWYLRSSRGQSEIAKDFRGATVGGISRGFVDKVKIPLPPLPEQKRIAAILDAADELRTKRRQSIQLLDDLIQSTFLEMFGDPVTNPVGWETKMLFELGNIQTGSTPPSKLDGMFDGKIPFITPSDLMDTWIKPSRTVTEIGAIHSRTVERGATLICCIGATIGKMGKTSTLSAFNQQINSISWYDEVVDDFGLEMMKFYKSKIARDGASTTLPILKKSRFEKISVPVPPFKLQQQFAAIVQSIEKQKARLKAHLKELDTLFASLQQRAFNGEL